jgi:hypothetical protein
MKRYGKVIFGAVLSICVLAAMALSISAWAAPGQSVGENTIFLERDRATAPYAVFQCWGDGVDTKKCWDTTDSTLKLSATYANCTVRFVQDAVTKDWFLTIPAALPSRSYKVIIRDGSAGAETNLDTAVATPVITWDKTAGCLKVNNADVFVIY